MIAFRYFFLAVILFSLACNGQNKDDENTESKANSSLLNNSTDNDSLARYSYQLWGSIPLSNSGKHMIIVGTGFFVRDGDRISIVTAAHVLNGTYIEKDRKLKRPIFPDTMFIRVFDDSGTVDSIPLNIKSIKDSTSPYFYYERPDIIVLPVHVPAKFHINSVERFMKRIGDKGYDSAEEISMYGYSNVFRERMGPQDRLRSHPFRRNLKLAQSYENSQLIPETGFSDTMYISLNFPSTITVGSGDSGSPIFFKIGNEIVFGAVCQGGREDGTPPLRCLRAKFVYRELCKIKLKP
jgi:hypothetical protein